MATAKVYIHGGDYDCSEAVRMCYRAVGVLPYGSYMWTGNEVALLTANGFKKRSLSSPQVGDVLFRDGHTELYLEGGMQGGARISETGGINGQKGDQTGKETTKSAYRASDWSALYRYEGGEDVEGIPCAIAAALVMEHIISHSAHGYSQPNRAGDGTVECVTITWGGEPVWYKLDKHIRFTFGQHTRVRTSPSTADSSNIMRDAWEKGDTAEFDGVAFGSGYQWGTYIGPTTGRRLFAAMGTTELGVVK